MSIWHEILLGFNKFQLFMKIERSGKPHKPARILGSIRNIAGSQSILDREKSVI